MLAAAGWDVEAHGLQGAPRLHVIVPDERHATVDLALRYLGLGDATARLRARPTTQGRIELDDLAAALAEGGRARRPSCRLAGRQREHRRVRPARAGDRARARSTARGCTSTARSGCGRRPRRRCRHLVEGVADADSWATDAHKWLNVPYDCGIAITRHPAAHRGGDGRRTPRTSSSPDGPPDPVELVPEFSRRARGVPVYAALRSLGRGGVADLVERLLPARRASSPPRSARIDGVEVLNDVVLNQVLVRFDDDDATTPAGRRRACSPTGWSYMSPTVFKGRAGMRISVSGWQTTPEDVDRSVQAVRQALAGCAGRAVVGDSRA